MIMISFNGTINGYCSAFIPFSKRHPVEEGLEINTARDRPRGKWLNGTGIDFQYNRQIDIMYTLKNTNTAHCRTSTMPCLLKTQSPGQRSNAGTKLAPGQRLSLRFLGKTPIDFLLPSVSFCSH